MADEEFFEEIEGEGEEEEQTAQLLDELEEEEVEEESILTEYDPDEFFSGAVTSLDSSLPTDLFEFEYSYGYNCHKYFNLCACDETVVCWSAGSILTFFDVNTKQTWFRRSTTGGTLGAVTSYRKDPNYRLATAEDREGHREPLIILYTWPQMDIDAVLRDGTTNAYSILDFSPDGELLASVGKEPDYNLTIWNWKRHKILLRTSAFTYDVNAVMFSPYCPGQLTTAGAAHVKFWKMSETFTGLKLKGELGRFGKTEICDVLGVYPMPDEKVLTGCEWGNVLVWEAGLVKVEVTRKGRKPCHTAPVIQFMLSTAGDEVTTIAQDGCIRAWYWDTVEQADPPEEDPYVELNPVAETCANGCQIMCLKHQKDMYWYAQDGNGGLWTIDLEIDKLECNHRKVMTYHAGKVVSMAALRTHHILITAGEDGALHAYDTYNHVLLARYQFAVPITCIFYPPIDVDPTSTIIIVGFADGIMRTMLLHPERFESHQSLIDIRVHSALTIHSEDSVNADVIDLLSLLKPHSKSLTQISINHQRTLLVTCAEDSTIFLYKLVLSTPFELLKLGFIETPNNIAYMTWKPGEEHVILLCGQVGFLMEATLPKVDTRNYSEITTFRLEFESYIETLVKKHFMRYRPFPGEEDLASLDEEALKAKDAGDDDDEEEEWLGAIELLESESMLGTTITWAEYCDQGVWVIQKGTGALLLVKPGGNKILKYAPIPGAWCDDITSLKFICEGRYLIVGTNTGYIRVFRMPTEEEDNPETHYMIWMAAMQKLLKKLKGRRLAKEELQPIPRIDFLDNYYLPMHDSYTGAITCIEISTHGKRLFTCGADGNIFSYIINFHEHLIPMPDIPEPPAEPPVMPKIHEPSTAEGDIMSHEQLKQKEEYDKMMAIANAHKKRVRDQLTELTVEYSKLIKANRSLPASQQIDVTLDPRPLAVQEQELQNAMALTVRKLAHQLEASTLGLSKMYNRNIIQLDVFPFRVIGIRDPTVVIKPLRQKNLSKAFRDQYEEVHQKMAEAALRGRRTESTVRRTGPRKASYGPPRVASFLLGLPPRQPHSLKKALRNYHQRLTRHHMQFIQIQEHLNLRPDPNAMPPGAAEALKEAEATIGNRLLKTQPDYVAPPGHNTQLRVCITRQEVYDNKREFNMKVLQLRDHKIRLVRLMKDIGERLSEIRIEIPPKSVKPTPAIPQIDEELEFPEKHLEIKPEKVTVQTRMSKKGKQVEDRKKSALAVRVRPSRVNRFTPITESRPLAASWDLLRARSDMESTPLEVEVRERRIKRHLYEQDMLVGEAEMSVQKFDSRLRQLQRERIRVQEKNQLLELHLFQMHREMNVLNRFEAHEDRLAERVYSKLVQVKAVQEQIEDCKHRIEEIQSEKNELDVECQELQRKFKNLVADNKFADFLRRIFKKKYRPPRDKDDDESSESESSESSSEEEDEGSVDSRDIGPIRLDPNICPEGCEKEIYEKTYELRGIRHKHEQDIIEKSKMVEMLNRDIDNHNKFKRKLSIQLDVRKNDLKEFMMEKQSCMNDVEQVVILRYDQMRASAVRGCTGPLGLSQTVVFPEAMLMKLRKRVLEIQDEIKQQKIRQKVNRTHLFRMNVDMRAMEQTASELRAQMRDVLTRKLGKPRKVDKTLDDMLRLMARRHKFNKTLGILSQVRVQIRGWKERLMELEKKYLERLNHHSNRLRLAAAIQADVLPLKPHKNVHEMVGGYNQADYERDVTRLRIVRVQQIEQIQQLRNEINALRLKAAPYPVTIPRWIQDETEAESIRLKMPPRSVKDRRKKYFPISPIQSQAALRESIGDVNLMKLLFDALDAMRVTRDDAQTLLADVTEKIPQIITGTCSRYDVVDSLVRKWMYRHGGDPSKYKKRTKAFDALASLVDRVVRQHIQEMQSMGLKGMSKVLEGLDVALKQVSDINMPLSQRIGPTLATLLHTVGFDEADTPETLTSLVKALMDEEHPLTQDSIDNISVNDVVEDLKDCGVDIDEDDMEYVVKLVIECLKAQLLDPEEAKRLQDEVEKAMAARLPKLNLKYESSIRTVDTMSHRGHSIGRISRVSEVKQPSETERKTSGHVSLVVPPAASEDNKEENKEEKKKKEEKKAESE